MATQSVVGLKNLPTAFCQPCFARGVVSPGFKVVAGEWFCGSCFKPERKTRPMRYQDVQKTKAMAAAYIPEADARCVVCTDKRVTRQIVCNACTRRFRIIRHMKSALRAYRDKGNLKCLQNAMAYVRRYKIKPEELEGC